MAVIEPIAYIRNDFKSKFGIPRQSGIVEALTSRIEFEPDYRNAEAVRGLEAYSHIWLIWGFSENVGQPWSPTVRPPRLGGNVRKGVFATRSPFRPNSLGLSCVRLGEIVQEKERGPVIHVFGADLMDGTPIYDIKPYLPYSDSLPEATGGFASHACEKPLRVIFAKGCGADEIPPETVAIIEDLLRLDPRPSYHDDPARVYGMAFGGLEIKFSADEETLTVHSISPAED